MKQGVRFIVRQLQEVAREGKERCSSPMLVGASMASATGATIGAKLAVLRNKSIKFYAASMGSNFFLLSSTYIGKLLTLQIVAQLVVTGFIISDKRDDKKDWITGAAAGTITGGFYAGLVETNDFSILLDDTNKKWCFFSLIYRVCRSGGPFRGLQGATAGAAVGEAVFHTWRLSKGVQRYQSKYGEAPAIDHPTTALLVESQCPPQKLAFPSLLPKSIKISDKEIERRIVIRMDELRKEMQEEVATLDSNDRVK
ncbi:hypothetical protein PsorP6_003610 [Peronosclerospora sorghi]|uniref:Uncharacterized protein n=1 Tax=Peronosclerospora sorghi TaxID=230839 RepID=A0ACC0VQI1_9STRA|nr:hypothetical protein PsorP6_003610 [Peronosclerospora sorghi]